MSPMMNARGTDDLNFRISIDGYDLFPTTDNAATAVSGPGDMAIAWGDGSNALSVGGFGDFAAAEGTNAIAKAGGPPPRSSIARSISATTPSRG
jgi:hypothetical protein